MTYWLFLSLFGSGYLLIIQLNTYQGKLSRFHDVETNMLPDGPNTSKSSNFKYPGDELSNNNHPDDAFYGTHSAGWCKDHSSNTRKVDRSLFLNRDDQTLNSNIFDMAKKTFPILNESLENINTYIRNVFTVSKIVHE